MLMIASGSSYAQITLENTYPSAYYNLRLEKLSSSGYKYVAYDTSMITLFNLNHTVFRTINIPPGGYSGPTTFYIWYVSEELFNTNPADIEYFFLYGHTGSLRCRVYDESGNAMFSQDSVSWAGASLSTGGFEEFISYTPSGYKMIIHSVISPYPTSIYSLPGFLPCHDCTNGVITSMAPNNSDLKKGTISNYPNPSKGETTIEYELPQGVTNADLVFYAIQGQEVKRFKVSNAFHDIIISTAELDAGTYYYQLQTSSGFKAGKKMVVIK